MKIIDNLKEIVGLVRKIDNLDLYRKLLDLQGEVQELTGDLLKKDRTIRDRDTEIQQLKEKLEFKAKLVRDGDDYFEVDEGGKPTGKPYCSHCWEANRIAVHVRQNPNNRKESACPRCKGVYNWRGGV